MVDVLCSKCRFGDHVNKRCYSVGWDACKGDKFETKREAELTKEIGKLTEKIKELRRKVGLASDLLKKRNSR